MEELVQLVATKTGLPPAQSRQAVAAVLDFLKQKLPAPLAGQVEAMLQGESGQGQITDLAQGLSNRLGGK